MNKYYLGKELYGDDFTEKQIEQWYKEEAEAYADLGSKNESTYKYHYHNLNKLHGFSKLNEESFTHVLGMGSAYGVEFEPILNKVKKLTILEPSDNLISNKIGNITPDYIKPEVDGSIKFSDNTFDLITCFGVLHHIPNVSFVLKEMLRTLKPGGHVLIREPIISMGNWNEPRQLLTKNERGIPVSIFDTFFKEQAVNVISKEYCYTATDFLQRKVGHLLKNQIHSYQSYVIIDKYISKLMAFNVHYHAQNMIQRIAPSSIFYVIQK